MLKMKIKQLEAILGKKIKRNTKVLGIDIATKTGFCIAKANTVNVIFDYNFVTFTNNDEFDRYQQIAKTFIEIIDKDFEVVIEDTFLGFNPKTFKLLSRFGGIVCGICETKGVVGYTFKMPSSLRAGVGIKMGKVKKGEAKKAVRKWLIDNLDLDVENDDIADSVVISLYGLIDNETKKNKRRKKMPKKFFTNSLGKDEQEDDIYTNSLMRNYKSKSRMVQVKNPKTGVYVKIDRKLGKIVSHKKSRGPYKGVPIARKSK